MFGLPIAEVAIGLAFVYLLLALICTTVNETIAGITGRRADLLEKGIKSLLGDDPALKDELLNHPLIASLAPKPGSKPSYIPASKFALALMDIVTGAQALANDSPALRAGLAKTGTPPFRKALATVLADSNPNLLTDQHKIEAWYDDGMDRVSGWYKRHTTAWIWALAAIVTFALNADTIHMAKTLWINQAVRSAVVESAKARATGERPEELKPLVEYTDANQPRTGVPVSPHSHHTLTPAERAELSELASWPAALKEWNEKKGSLDRAWWLVELLLGWLFTIAAVTLGAPFWFDTLNRFMNIRSAGRAPDEPRDKSSPAPATTQPSGAQT
jgi:hypothetical protein